jgi:hypothetical protein
MTGRLFRRIGALSVALAALILVVNAGSQTPALSTRVGPPKPELYKRINDAKTWKNPFIVVRPEGIEIVASALGRRQVVVVRDVERTLTSLPTTSWPYGRVVAVQPLGIRDPNGSDDKPISSNLTALVEILKKMNVEADYWPP